MVRSTSLSFDNQEHWFPVLSELKSFFVLCPWRQFNYICTRFNCLLLPYNLNNIDIKCKKKRYLEIHNTCLPRSIIKEQSCRVLCTTVVTVFKFLMIHRYYQRTFTKDTIVLCCMPFVWIRYTSVNVVVLSASWYVCIFWKVREFPSYKIIR